MEKILDDFIVKKNFNAILDKVRVERIPRFVRITDADGNEEEIAVIVNAAWFRQMRDKAELFAWLQSKSDFGRLRDLLQSANERAETYAGSLDSQAAELAARACPLCRKTLMAVAEARIDKNSELRKRIEETSIDVPAGVNHLLERERTPVKVQAVV